jgi:hypothetical protein
MALVIQDKKGKGKGSKSNSEGETSQLRKKELSKIKCFACHNTGDYESWCLEKKKGQGNTQTTTLARTQLDEFVTKFEREFSLVSFLNTSSKTRSAWYLDNNASHHMIEAHDLQQPDGEGLIDPCGSC